MATTPSPEDAGLLRRIVASYEDFTDAELAGKHDVIEATRGMLAGVVAEARAASRGLLRVVIISHTCVVAGKHTGIAARLQRRNVYAGTCTRCRQALEQDLTTAADSIAKEP
jgi:hypothetical protein